VFSLLKFRLQLFKRSKDFEGCTYLPYGLRLSNRKQIGGQPRGEERSEFSTNRAKEGIRILSALHVGFYLNLHCGQKKGSRHKCLCND